MSQPRPGRPSAGWLGTTLAGVDRMRYGTMRDNVLSIDALLADGSHAHFGPTGAEQSAEQPLSDDLLRLGEREAAEIDARFPKVMRRVGGYNIDALVPGTQPNNLAHLLVGSEGYSGLFHRHRAEALALLSQQSDGGVPLSDLPSGHGCGPASGDTEPAGG